MSQRGVTLCGCKRKFWQGGCMPAMTMARSDAILIP